MARWCDALIFHLTKACPVAHLGELLSCIQRPRASCTVLERGREKLHTRRRQDVLAACQYLFWLTTNTDFG